MDLEHLVVSSFTTAGLALCLAILYVVLLRLISKVGMLEGWRRTGLTLGDRRSWLIAAALLPAWLLVAWITYQWFPVDPENTTSPYHSLLGRGLTAEVMVATLSYGVVSAGFGEELLFRGLIGGALSRKFRARTANIAQAAIFLAPHLLILFVSPRAIVLLPTTVFGLGVLTGWLRIRSGSIGPGLLLHGLGNALVGILAATNVH